MLRGLITGTVTGGLAAAIIVVLASQFLPVIRLVAIAPEPGEVAVPAGSEFNAERPDTKPVLPATEARPDAVNVPGVSQPTSVSEPSLDTSPADTPQAGAAEATLDSPAVGAAPEIAGGTDPGVETALDVVSPTVPVVDSTPDTPDPLDTPLAESAPEGDVLQAPEAGSAPEIVAADETDPVVTDVAVSPDQPALETAPTAEPSAEEPTASGEPAEIDSPVEIVDIPSTLMPDAPLGIGLTQPDLGALSPGLETDQPPNIGTEPEAPLDAASEPALIRNAIAFEPSGAPLLSLVLIDAAGVGDPAEFTDFPVPMTVALDPNSAGAGARMAAWRAAGLEVAVLTPLPAGATPADVEVSFQSFLDAIPQAVAVMDLPEALLQESRPRSAQVVEILAETGHGMVTYDHGLNSGLQIAETKGVPATSVFRVIDDGSKDTAAIIRALDQGAFRAGQAGPVVLVGQMRPESVAAIADWAQSNRAASVNPAPLSAVLRGK